MSLSCVQTCQARTVKTNRARDASHRATHLLQSVRGAPPPLGLSYLHAHLSLTCPVLPLLGVSRNPPSKTPCVGRQFVQFTVLGFRSKRTGDRYRRVFPAEFIVRTVRRLRWLADASGAVSPTFVTLSIPSGKHHCEFSRWGKKFVLLLLSLFLSVYSQRTQSHINMVPLGKCHRVD